MIIITGAAGFIGSCFIQKLNEEGYFDLVLVDDFSDHEKNKNLTKKRFALQVDRDEFPSWLKANHLHVQFVFHLSAQTGSTKSDHSLLKRLNLSYTRGLWEICVEFGLPFIYASSAATNGLAEKEHDSHYKNDFDIWAQKEKESPYFWVGLKFFNAYGPNEYHKGIMASVVLNTYHQIMASGEVNLFQSDDPNYKDGQQIFESVYVKDVTDLLYFFMHHRKDSGIYTISSGNPRTFLDMANNTFDAIGKEPKINFIPMPEDIRDRHYYSTEAKMENLASIGYHKPFTPLEAGINDFVKNYLSTNNYL